MPDHFPKDPTIRNVVLLALCQALAMSSLSLTMTVTALAGTRVAPSPGLATIPLALQFCAMMATTLPASFFMGRFGRRPGFLIGAAFGVAGGLISALGLYQGSFALFCVGAICFGAFAAVAQYYRFAAADTASDAFRSRAISLVLAGGVAAGVMGPEIGKHSVDFFESTRFAGAYLAITILCAFAGILLSFIRIPHLRRPKGASTGRPVAEIMRQPKFLLAVFGALVGYGSMNLVMVSTPLAMTAHHHSFEIAALVIQVHVLGMYLPSFFTGGLIQRFGCPRIMLMGAILILGCVAVNFSGLTAFHFALALGLLGLGWNFLFVGGTSLLTETYRPEEMAKTQAANDFIVFSTVAMTALSSGALHAAYGWELVNFAVVPPLIAVILALLWWLGRRRAAVQNS